MKRKNTLFLAGLLCVMGTLGSSAAWSVTPQSPLAWGERWKNLPPTPAPVAALKPAYASVNGIQLYYATTGEGAPVVLLHGGLANSDYWGQQVAALAKHHKVIVVDSRGHGRSTRDERPYSYDLMSDDVVALLDLRKITAPVLIVDGDRDEAIVREHLEYIANTIPNAGLLILPNTSHFAFIQAPKEFNEAILNFIDYK